MSMSNLLIDVEVYMLFPSFQISKVYLIVVILQLSFLCQILCLLITAVKSGKQNLSTDIYTLILCFTIDVNFSNFLQSLFTTHSCL
jgi:hypothetical protein